jgi:hypothetical protein
MYECEGDSHGPACVWGAHMAQEGRIRGHPCQMLLYRDVCCVQPLANTTLVSDCALKMRVKAGTAGLYQSCTGK